LIPGVYTIEVSSAGFTKAVSKDVTVNVDQAARVDIGLTLGDVTQSIEVTAAAPLLQSDRSEVATTFSSHQLENLPSFDRNFQAYELLTPGTQRLGWNHAPRKTLKQYSDPNQWPAIRRYRLPVGRD